MGKFLKISEAAKLTGQPEVQIRRLVLTTLSRGSNLDKSLIKQREDEDWEIDSALLEDAMNSTSARREQKDEMLELISDQLNAKDHRNR